MGHFPDILGEPLLSCQEQPAGSHPEYKSGTIPSGVYLILLMFMPVVQKDPDQLHEHGKLSHEG